MEYVPASKKRWEQLLIYIALAICSQIGWIMLTAIPDESRKVFGVNNTLVTLLATMYPICYIPGTVLAARAMRRGGLRATLLESAIWMVWGSILRLAGCGLALGTSSSKIAYIVTLLGQTAMALGQPHLVNSPTALANEWFPISERDLAGTLGLLGNIVGQALGEAMSPIILSVSGSMTAGVGLVSLVLGFIPVFITFIWTYYRCETRAVHKDTVQKVLAIAGPRQLLQVWIAALKEDKDFTLLWAAFCLGISIFNALLSLAAQWLEPCGYSDSVIGTMTAVFVLVGIPAAALCGAILDATRAYRPVLKTLLVLDLIGTGSLLLAARHNFVLALYAAFAFLGGALIASSACLMDTAVELTYPKPPELSTGLLFCGGNTLSIATTYIMLALINSQHGKCLPLNAVFNTKGGFNAPVSFFLFLAFVICCFLILNYRGPYRRLQAELQAVISESSDNESQRGDTKNQEELTRDTSTLQEPLLNFEESSSTC